MSEMNRVQRWRQRQREAGKETLTVWLPREMRLYIEDMALKRHCSPSDLIQQALTTCYPLSADVTVTVTDTSVADTVVTDTSQIRSILQQELRAFFGESPPYQGMPPVKPVTDTITDTITHAEAVAAAPPETWNATDTVTDTENATDTATDIQDLPVFEAAMDHQGEYVTDTVTDTHIRTQDVTAAALETPLVTDTVTDTHGQPGGARGTAHTTQGVTDTVTDTVTVTEAKHRGRKPVLRPGILALLDEHPDGLTAAELKVYLGTAKPIGDTLAGMVKAALLVKTGSGHAIRYQLAEATAP